MTYGALCNGGCGQFMTSKAVAATYEHTLQMYDEDTDTHSSTRIEAHLCDDCAINISSQLTLPGEQGDVLTKHTTTTEGHECSST